MEMTKALSDYIDKHAALEAETKRVSKSEFEEFLSAYPRPLVRDVFGACDPPAVSYNDFELGYWPRSIVASTHLYDDKPGEYFYEPPEERYFSIVTNHAELHAESQRLTEEYEHLQAEASENDEEHAAPEQHQGKRFFMTAPACIRIVNKKTNEIIYDGPLVNIQKFADMVTIHSGKGTFAMNQNRNYHTNVIRASYRFAIQRIGRAPEEVTVEAESLDVARLLLPNDMISCELIDSSLKGEPR